MSYYQQARYQQQQLHYSSKGGQSWPDGYGHKKPSGTYDNATGYSFDNGGGRYGKYASGGGSMGAGASDKFGYSFGIGSMATSAKGSGSYGDGYGSNDFGGGQWRGGGCKIQSYANNVRICACSVAPSYQSETRQWSIRDQI